MLPLFLAVPSEGSRQTKLNQIKVDGVQTLRTAFLMFPPTALPTTRALLSRHFVLTQACQTDSCLSWRLAAKCSPKAALSFATSENLQVRTRPIFTSFEAILSVQEVLSGGSTLNSICFVYRRSQRSLCASAIEERPTDRDRRCYRYVLLSRGSCDHLLPSES